MAKKYKVLNINYITTKSKLQKEKLYNFLNGKYKNLSEEDRQAIFKATFPEVKTFFRDICNVKITISNEP